jgi:hypothetical protein
MRSTNILTTKQENKVSNKKILIQHMVSDINTNAITRYGQCKHEIRGTKKKTQLNRKLELTLELVSTLMSVVMFLFFS